MSFWEELGRRNVIKVAAAYAIVGWLLTQIATAIFPVLLLPDWILRAFVVLLILGFPVAALLAWAYEVTPAGIRRTASTDDAAGLSIWRSRAFDLAIVGALVAMLAYTLWDHGRGQDSETGNPSIAVLPFADMSSDNSQEYFADGIAEELLNQLTQLEGLDIAGRTSSFAFKGSNQDLRAIGAQLGVANILAGSVRRDGDTIRVAAQLIDSRTGFYVWSQTYDRRAEDIFAVQDDIALSVAGALSIALNVEGRNVLSGTGTTSIEAYDVFLTGLAVEKAAGPDEAIAFYRQATELDPEYAEAWAQLGFAIGASSWNLPSDLVLEAQRRSREHLMHALALNPNLAAAYTYLGQSNFNRGDWLGAAEAHQKAMELAPSDISRRIAYANVLGRTGHVQEAIRLEEIGRDRDPFQASTSVFLSTHYAQVGRFAEARAEIDRLKIPGFEADVASRRLNMALSEGDPPRIREAIQVLGEVAPRNAALLESVLAVFDSPEDVLVELRRNFEDGFESSPEERTTIASLAAYFGDPALALEAMAEELRGPRSSSEPIELRGSRLRTGTIWYPHMQEMRRLPGFKTLVREVGLVAYWDVHGLPDFCRPVGDEDFECD